jgi:hypothetical protein
MRQALSDADFVIDTAIARASTGASDAPPPPSDMAIVAVKVMIFNIHGSLYVHVLLMKCALLRSAEDCVLSLFVGVRTVLVVAAAC